MPIITLLTDFGTNNEYVGAMKGVILSINPSVRVIDIHHQLDPHDMIGAAYQVKAYYSFFPPGTIHVVVVDPGVGGDRHVIAVELNGYIFLSPDNGVLSLLIDKGHMQRIHYVENENYWLKPVSNTFHEIAVNRGNAQNLLSAVSGDKVYVSLSNHKEYFI